MPEIAGILDPTLTQADKAAPAKYVGDIIRNRYHLAPFGISTWTLVPLIL